MSIVLRSQHGRRHASLSPLLGIVVVLGIGLLLAFGLQSEFNLNLLALVLIWSVLGLSWNMVSGYAGLISFGHSVFFGLGAFTIVLSQSKLGLSPWLGLPLAAVIGMVAGVIIGAITLRLSGVYFALAMLCYPMVLVYLFEYAGFQEVTVPMHRSSPFAFMQFESQRSYALLALGLLAIALLISVAIEHSRLGLWLRSIKQNEAAASALGINCFRWKITGLALSGAVGALAGALYAQTVLVVTPLSVFGVAISAQALVICLFGGVGTLWGPLIGAVVLVPLGELLKQKYGATLPGINGVVLGIIVIVIVLFAPEGVFWRLMRLRKREQAEDPYSKAGRDPFPFLKPPVIPSTQGHGIRGTRSSVSAKPDAESPGSPGSPAMRGTDAPDLTVPHAAETPRRADVVMKIEGLSRSFGGVKAVNGATFQVYQGEILGVIGPNGAGKTTLMNLINGFTKAQDGSIQLDGTELVGQATHRIAALGMGRTFQVARVFPDMSLFGNVAVGAVAGAQRSSLSAPLVPALSADTAQPNDSLAASVHKKSSGTQAWKVRAWEAIDLVGLRSRASVRASEATARDLRLMELARAAACSPKVLLVDECLAGLSSDDVEDMVTALQALRRAGTTIVIIEHTMHAMTRLVDRFIVLDHGTVIAAGVPSVVLKDERVLQAYLGKRFAKGLVHAEN